MVTDELQAHISSFKSKLTKLYPVERQRYTREAANLPKLPIDQRELINTNSLEQMLEVFIDQSNKIDADTYS